MSDWMKKKIKNIPRSELVLGGTGAGRRCWPDVEESSLIWEITGVDLADFLLCSLRIDDFQTLNNKQMSDLE